MILFFSVFAACLLIGGGLLWLGGYFSSNGSQIESKISGDTAVNFDFKKENSVLKKQIKELTEKSKVSVKEPISSKEKGALSALEKENSVLKKQIKELTEKSKVSVKEPISSKEKESLAALEKENSDLKKQIKELTEKSKVSVKEPISSKEKGALSALEKENSDLKKQVEAFVNKHRKLEISATAQKDKDAEIARLGSLLAKIEGENDRAHFEIENLRDELDSFKGKTSEKPVSLPKPVHSPRKAMPESEAIDEMQAQLDLERVAHQKTKDEFAQIQRELEQVKKIAAARMVSGSTSGVADRTAGSKFKTMAIGMRNPMSPNSEENQSDLIKNLEKVHAQKEQVEAELERLKKEMQILKMRNSSV